MNHQHIPGILLIRKILQEIHPSRQTEMGPALIDRAEKHDREANRHLQRSKSASLHAAANPFDRDPQHHMKLMRIHRYLADYIRKNFEVHPESDNVLRHSEKIMGPDKGYWE